MITIMKIMTMIDLQIIQSTVVLLITEKKKKKKKSFGKKDKFWKAKVLIWVATGKTNKQKSRNSDSFHYQTPQTIILPAKHTPPPPLHND